MKKLITVLFIIAFCNSILSQVNINIDAGRTNWYEPAPKGFEFIRNGSFQDSLFVNNDTLILTMSVAPFWVSNEITNIEYREFTNYLKTKPNDSLCYYTWKNEDRCKSSICKLNNEIAGIIIDPIILKNEMPEFVDYFNNKKYDNYPVIGVSYIGAMYFCVWKTKSEIEKMNAKEYSINDYRLPSLGEWKYLCSLVPSERKNNISGLNKSISGKKNELKIYNLSGNVSEWTSSTPDSLFTDQRVVMGGSWKTKSNLFEKNIVDKNTFSSTIGFRIVRSYVGAKN